MSQINAFGLKYNHSLNLISSIKKEIKNNKSKNNLALKKQRIIEENDAVPDQFLKSSKCTI